MPNSYFQFKQFIIHQDRCAMKVTTDACLFGAWVAEKIGSQDPIAIGSEITSLLDIGTGTGLLSLMLAQKNERLLIDAIEIDKEAAMQATENVNQSPWKNRIQVISSDVNTFLNNRNYDLIISNPPFYENELKSPDGQKNLAHHGEELKLAQLITIIKNKLAADGQFFLLLPVKRDAEIKELLLKNELMLTDITFVRQSVNHDFFRVMIAGRLNAIEAAPAMINEITIKEDNQNYTADFTRLLKEYYLHL
ncbi:MAG TPA: methyltransferase [Chitinophagaceae bacterium]